MPWMHDPVERWLLDEGRLLATTPALMAGLVARLDDAGLDLLLYGNIGTAQRLDFTVIGQAP
jgi:hypothetical protein